MYGCSFLRWYGTPVDINVDKKYINKYFHRFKIYKFCNIKPKIWFRNIWMVKTITVPVGFELLTNRFVVDALTYCDTLLGDNN